MFGGADWAIGAALSGLVAITNFYLLGMMVQRLVANRGNALVAIGFALKFIITGGLLIALVRQFEPAPVLVGSAGLAFVEGIPMARIRQMTVIATTLRMFDPSNKLL